VPIARSIFRERITPLQRIALMKRVIKWVIIVIVALVLILIGTAVAALYLINPNDYKDKISEVVKDRTGRELRIDGDIQVSIFPWLGFEIGRTQLSNAEGFGKEPMLRFQKVEARIRLLSLLSGTPQVGTLVLDGVDARLIRHRDGKTNWADLQQLAETKPTPPESAKPAPPAAVIALPAVQGVRIENAHILWQDQLNDQKLELNQFNLKTGAIRLRQSIPVRLSFALDSASPPLQGTVTLQTDAWANLDDQVYRLDKLQLIPQLRGDTLPQGQLEATLTVQQLTAALKQEDISIKGLVLAAQGIEVNGEAGLKNFNKPHLNFALATDTLNLDQLLPAQAAGAEAKTAESGHAGAALLPLGLIKLLDFDGELNIKRLIMSNLTVTDTRLQAEANNGVLQLKPQASLYDGRYQGNIRIDASGEVGKITMQEQLSGVHMGPLLHDYLQKDYLSGVTNLTFKANAKGNTLDTMIATLNGLATLKVEDAQMKSKHVLYDVAQAIVKRQDLGKPENFEKEITVFDSITGRFDIKDGVAHNDDFLALSKRVHIKGKGWLNLTNKKLDYTVYLIPKKSLEVPWIGGRRYDLKDEPIPYHVYGNLDDLKFDADFEAVFKRLTKQHLEEQRQKKEAELKRKLDEEKQQLDEKKAAEKQKLQEKLEQEKQELRDKLLNKFR
jgi:AsmA protein